MPSPAVAIFSILLVITGTAKLRRPRDTASALHKLHVPSPMPVTIAVSLIEVTVGLAALLSGAPFWYALQAGLFAVFLVWVTAALVLKVPIASCGCLGRDDTPPYWGHIALNVIAVAVSLWATTAGSLPWSTAVLAWPTNFVISATGVWLAWRILDDGARVHGMAIR